MAPSLFLDPVLSPTLDPFLLFHFTPLSVSWQLSLKKKRVDVCRNAVACTPIESVQYLSSRKAIMVLGVIVVYKALGIAHVDYMRDKRARLKEIKIVEKVETTFMFSRTPLALLLAASFPQVALV